MSCTHARVVYLCTIMTRDKFVMALVVSLTNPGTGNCLAQIDLWASLKSVFLNDDCCRNV